MSYFYNKFIHNIFDSFNKIYLCSCQAKLKGFTLAETLITLVIIGVVATITVPSVLQSVERKDTVIKVKKAYHTLSNAYLKAKLVYGEPDTWGFGGRDAGPGGGDDSDNYVAKNANILMDKLFSKAVILKACQNTKDFSKCNLADKYYKEDGSLDSGVNSVTTGVVLADGLSYIFYANVAECKEKRGKGLHLENTCGLILVDTNGTKGPNKFGRDLFSFYLTKYGVIPTGTNAETAWPFSAGSLGRTAWVLYNENMDYIDCPNKLGWNKMNSCKN